ncbi:3'-5' exonuclease [Anaerovirgula multivorans]|uniref:3'-5' exonuclease n=1 Tax=Anaerovirgula multivorans TaxID=312168 RepID=UPI0038BCC45B
MTYTNQVSDTLSLSRKYFPNLKNHKLGTVAKKLNIPLENAHNAIDDAYVCGQIYI